MSRRRTRKKPKITGGYAALTAEWLFKSEAYRSLTLGAKAVLPYFIFKTGCHVQEAQAYHQEFSFTYSEAVKLGFRRQTFGNTIPELYAKGFIDCVYRGGKRGLGHTSTRFKLSRRHERYGQPDFEELRWDAITSDAVRCQGSKADSHKAASGTCSKSSKNATRPLAEPVEAKSPAPASPLAEQLSISSHRVPPKQSVPDKRGKNGGGESNLVRMQREMADLKLEMVKFPNKQTEAFGRLKKKEAELSGWIRSELRKEEACLP